MLSSADQPGDTVTYHLVGLTPGWEVCRLNTWLGHCVVFLEVEHNYLLHSLCPPRSKNGYQLTVREILWNAEEVLGGGGGGGVMGSSNIPNCFMWQKPGEDKALAKWTIWLKHRYHRTFYQLANHKVTAFPAL